MIILFNQKKAIFFVAVWVLFFLLCHNNTGKDSAHYKSESLNEYGQNLEDSLKDIQFDINKCAPVSGTKNGLKFTGEFIVDSNVYLKMTFTNISKEKLFLFRHIIMVIREPKRWRLYFLLFQIL